jgi:hypothetical protein
MSSPPIPSKARLASLRLARFHEAVSEILQFLDDDLLAGCN